VRAPASKGVFGQGTLYLSWISADKLGGGSNISLAATLSKLLSPSKHQSGEKVPVAPLSYFSNTSKMREQYVAHRSASPAIGPMSNLGPETCATTIYVLFG
jgi:hypothetical protein